MTQKRFAPKDAKIIRDNPGKSPEELTASGLSKNKRIEPVKIEQAALPAKATGRTPNHVVRLLNKATRVVVELGFRTASALSKHNPNQYQILS